MNYVDANFRWLLSQWNGKSKSVLYEEMKERYCSLPKEVKKSFEDFFEKYPYWGKLKEEEKEYEEIEKKALIFAEHQKELEEIYDGLGDYRSKKLFFAILYNWYSYDTKTLQDLMDQTYVQYYDLDLFSVKEEVFVDVGAYIGDSILNFIHSYGKDSYKKIYGYEVTKESYQTMEENLKGYPSIILKRKAVGKEKGHSFVSLNSQSNSANTLKNTGEEEVEVVSLDEDIQEEITMIKMDIEGGEKDALLGCKNHIEKEHPKLLISIYHGHEDLWKIPTMIRKWYPDYQFFLRFYGSSLFPTEIILYAIPKKEEF